MNSKKLYYILVGVLLLLAIAILLSAREANLLLGNQSKSLVALKVKSQETADQKAQLTKDKKDISAYSDLNNIAKSVVPQDKDQAEAVREIVNLAAQSGISELSSITFPPSTLGGSTAGTPNNLTQVTKVAGIAGVYSLQITVSQADPNYVPYSNFITFLSKLEQNRRTAEVNSITVQPDDKSPNLVTFTLVINEFIKP
jgi:hypothetical protein